MAIQLKRNTALNWSLINPVLESGELGFETDRNKIKVGNGISAWNVLSYLNYDITEYLTSDVLNFISGVTSDVQAQLDSKAVLISGETIKTINGASVVGAGNLTVATESFTYEQLVPNVIWTINHNMGKIPSLKIIDGLNEEVMGAISYNNLDTLTITFSEAITGAAYLT
jgi:hypothetical protein